jgi:hypothetical protein
MLGDDSVDEVLGLDGVTDVEDHRLAASSQESDLLCGIFELIDLSCGDDHECAETVLLEGNRLERVVRV